MCIIKQCIYGVYKYLFVQNAVFDWLFRHTVKMYSMCRVDGTESRSVINDIAP